jgi:hypothetical protein
MFRAVCVQHKTIIKKTQSQQAENLLKVLLGSEILPTHKNNET